MDTFSGLVDSSVVIHALRGLPLAIDWMETQDRLAITPIAWLEIMYGAKRKADHARFREILNQFELVPLTDIDQFWAMEQMEALRFSHGVAVLDCLIASVCLRLGVPLYTHNIRHMQVLLPPHLIILPFPA